MTEAAAKVRVNGKEEVLPRASMTIGDYLASKGVRPETVAVEVNLTVIPKTDYARTFLKSGDEIEVVRFVGGGAV